MNKAFYTPPKTSRRRGLVDPSLMVPSDDLPRAKWSPFNTRTQSWSTGSIISVARQHHNAVDKIYRASSPSLLPNRGSNNRSAEWLHGAMTESRSLAVWPRGALPLESAMADEALLPARPSHPGTRTQLPVNEIYPRRLIPAAYSPPPSPATGMLASMVWS